MSARLSQRFYTCVGLLVLGGAAACSNGLVTIQPLPAAGGGGPDAGSPVKGGSGGTISGAGGAGESRGDPDGMPRLPPCDEGNEQEQARERELREAFVDAFNSGRYCPNTPDFSRRELILDRELEWRARGLICITFESREWGQIRGAPVWAWVLWDVPSLEDAKNALLYGDHTQLCEEAERTPFRYVGLGHRYDAWTVLLAPGSPDDSQKP